MHTHKVTRQVYRLSPEAHREGERERKGGGEAAEAGEKAAGLEPIRPREAPSTCTARPLGRAPVTR